ncbi:MAG TPA: sulfotransferase, partial [Cryomorphaceae bacterium]|nr:sulfotransferase [Cryomorphaceae bacterium]
DPIPTATTRSLLDHYADVELSDLTDHEVRELRPLLYEELSSKAGETVFLKLHDACSRTPTGKPLISQNATKGMVYIVRNPLDIVASYAFHLNKTIDEAIAKMNEQESIASAKDKLNPQIPYLLGSWSYHVQSWLENDYAIPVFVLKYEDLFAEPVNWFSKVLNFAHLQCTEDEIIRAIEATDFQKLKEEEDQNPFPEKHINAPRFFRKGQVQNWREELSSQQVNRIISDHGKMMKKLGYL